MNADEAVKALRELTDSDPECAHIDADCVLCDLLRDNGFEDVADAFRDVSIEVGFWYA